MLARADPKKTTIQTNCKTQTKKKHTHQTPFIRQNTPHPKELKAKAHKLFAKEKSKHEEHNLDTVSEEVSLFYFIAIYIYIIVFNFKQYLFI